MCSSDLDGVVFGDAEMKKDARAEFAQGFDGKNFGLDGGHSWPFFEQIAYVEGLARTQYLRRICVFNSSFAQDLRPGICRRQAQRAGQAPPLQMQRLAILQCNLWRDSVIAGLPM